MCALKNGFYLCLILASTIPGYGTVTSDGAADVHLLVPAGETVDIVCNSDVLLARCGLTHTPPNGTDFLFVNKVDRTSCKLTMETDSSGSGLWTCVFWTSSSPRRNNKTVTLAVAGRPAALDRELAVGEEDSVTLSCVRSGQMIPISECYFTSHKQHKIQTNDMMTLLTAQHALAGREGEGDAPHAHVTAPAHDVAGADADNEPIVISVQTYVCANLAFLATFVALVYCKERYYTRYYGTTWLGGDDAPACPRRDPCAGCAANPLVAVV